MVSVGYWIIGLSFSYYSLRLRGPNPISGVPDVKCKLVARPIGGRRGGFAFCRPVDLEWWSGAPRLLWDFVLIYEFFRNNVRYFHMILGSCPDCKGTTRFLPFPFSPTSLGKIKTPNSPLFIFPFTMPCSTYNDATSSTLHAPRPAPISPNYIYLILKSLLIIAVGSYIWWHEVHHKRINE